MAIREDSKYEVPFESGPGQTAGWNDTQTDKDLALEPNRFPRETGHDSLSEEEAYLS